MAIAGYVDQRHLRAVRHRAGLVGVRRRRIVDVVVAARIALPVKIGLGQRIAGVVGLARPRRQRHPRDALPGQRINHRHPGERHVAGIGHRHRVVEHVANRIGQRIAVAARHIQEYLVDGNRRIVDQRHLPRCPTPGRSRWSPPSPYCRCRGRRPHCPAPSRSAWVSV